MAHKYQNGSEISLGVPIDDNWYSWSTENPIIENPDTSNFATTTISPWEEAYHEKLSVGDMNGNQAQQSKGGLSDAQAGGIAAALNVASGLADIGTKYFDNKNSNPYVAYDSSWGGVASNNQRQREGINAVRSNLINYSDMNSINDFAAFGGYQPKDYAVGGHLAGVKPQDSDNISGSIGMSTLSGAAKGAALGTQIMPGWGTLIGGIVGTVSGLTRGSIAAGQNNRAIRNLNHSINQVNYMNDINKDNQIMSIMDNNIRSTFPFGGQMFQYGGNLDPQMLQQLMAQQGQPQDFGDTGNGVTTFNEGGSHEMNPNGGIPQGIAPDGEENLVEEGEVKYKDYIYSDRLIASKQLLKEHNLPTKYAGKSFAKIADKLQEESKDRPNDEISKSTLDDMMTRLEDAQEEYKAEKEVEDKASQIDNMSPEEKAELLDQMQMMSQQQAPYGMQQPQGLDPMMAQQMMQQDPYAAQAPMSPEEQAMMEQQMAQQGGQPFCYGGKKLQDGGPTMLATDYYPSPTIEEQTAKMVNSYYDYLMRHNYNAPEGTRFAGMSAYAPFYDQYDDIESRMPVKKPVIESNSYAYEQPQWSIDLNNVVNAYKTKKSQDAFYDRWIGSGKDKDGNYWYYRHHPEDKIRRKPTLADVHAIVADMGYGDSYIEYADGGNIHIKPSKKGTFTAAATKHGKSVQEFASQVLANPENYSPAMVKKANFSKNASKWHSEGGHLYQEGGMKDFRYWDAEKNDYKPEYLEWVNNLDFDNKDNDLYLMLKGAYNGKKPFTKERAINNITDKIYGDAHKVVARYYDKMNPVVETAPQSTSTVIEPQYIPVSPLKPINTKAPANKETTVTDPNAWMNPSMRERLFGTVNELGPLFGAIASMSPLDYEYSNDLNAMRGEVQAHTVPNIVYEGNYEPMDINNPLNLLAAQNMATQLVATQGGTRATNNALRLAYQNAAFAAQNNLAEKVAEMNYARRKAIADKAVDVANMNAAINEKNAALLADADAKRLAYEQAAAQAREESRTERAKSIGATWENVFTESGKMAQQELYNRMYQKYLAEHTLQNALKNKENTTTQPEVFLSDDGKRVLINGQWYNIETT